MTVRSVPWIPSTAGQTVPSEIVRLAMKSIVSTGGIASLTDLSVAAHGTPNMTVDVAAGGAWIAGTSVATQGFYFLYNDATLSVPIATSDPSNPRIDLIVAQIRDNAEDASGSTDARIVPVAGTPAGSPVAPSAPASSIVLAQVLVGTGVASIVSGNITDKRTASNSAAVSGIGSAWTPYTPTFTNVTSGAGNFAYKLAGKTLTLRARFTGGSATATNVVTFTLPLGLSAIDPAGLFSFTNNAGVAEAAWLSGTTVTMYQDAAGTSFSGGALMNNRGISPVTFEVA